MTWVWFDGTLGAGYQLGLEITATLYEHRTDHQHLAIYDTREFGRVLALDEVIQTSESDEFIYHEMMAHVPILAHGAVDDVCIIGGGDGGMLREVVKHPLQRATMVELDPAVVEMSREHLPRLSAGAFDHPCTNLLFADGAKYVAETDDRFDVIIIDSTDPLGPAEILFSEAFYADCKRCLKPGGILVTQNGVPMTQAEELTTSMRRLRRHFAEVSCYLAPVPTYFGGHMAFGWATDHAAHRTVSLQALTERHRATELNTRYYNPAIHQAAFALPNSVQALVNAGG